MDTSTMRSLVKLAPGPGNVSVVERPRPTARPDEVVLAVLAAGVCGTDLHIESGDTPCATPVILGHEVCGIVEDLGADVDPGWLGARVVSETATTCGLCSLCRDGRANLCRQRRPIGIEVDGAFAPYVTVPARNLHRVPELLDDHAASLMEPLACVCHVLGEPALVQPGDRVLVTGPGPMGLLAAQVARAYGGDVTVSGLSTDAERLAVARRLGFDTVEAETAAVEDVDVAIETSGSAAAAAAGMRAARPGGRYVQIGIFTREVTVPIDLMLYKELEYRSGFASTPQSWRRALAFSGRGDVELAPLVTEVAPLTEWERVFADLRSAKGMKIVLEPAA